MKKHYNIVFEGKTVPGKEIDLVKKALMNILKADDQSIDRLFSGKRVLIRKNVEAATAKKFQKAFEDIGAVCNLEQVKVSGEVSAPNQQEGIEMTETDSGKNQVVKPESAESVRTADGEEMTPILKLYQGKALWSILDWFPAAQSGQNIWEKI